MHHILLVLVVYLLSEQIQCTDVHVPNRLSDMYNRVL